jgi:G6PDH family F420-dependent oxidoreductase
MTELGYAFSSEENGPNELVRYARMAEEAGFTFGLISDHFHPWLDQQGNSPFVWSVLGGIAQVTQRLRVGTGVTCPTIRIHPAIIAQAAATIGAMMPGRFFLGVGTGENLNEHILGDKWPPVEIRQEMLTEAVSVIRLLWKGGMQSHHGAYYVVENARIYTLPDKLPDIYVAAAGQKSAEVAGRIGDGLISTAPKKEIIQKFDAGTPRQRPHIGQITVCWSKTEQEARKTAHDWWRYTALKGEVPQELATPLQFEQASKIVREDDVANEIVCGPDPQKHIAEIKKYVAAGFEQVYVHQVGPDQEGFFQFYQKEILPKFK